MFDILLKELIGINSCSLLYWSSDLLSKYSGFFPIILSSETSHFFHQDWSCRERKKVVITETGYKNEQMRNGGKMK